MLIIEGSDCLGKSTIVKAISDKLMEPGCRHYTCHMSRPDDSFNFFTDYANMMGVNTIQDRFHLGALAYHENTYTPAERTIIEGRLLMEGSVIVVLYAADFRWYENHIEADTRGNLLSRDKLCEANQRFAKMVSMQHQHHPLAPHIDFSFDISPAFGHKKIRWVSQTSINTITQEWLKRREAAERWMQKFS
jgi:hypothetical protein